MAAGIHRFGSIHDCLLCHPNDAHRLAEILRQTFAGLYAAQPGGTQPEALAEWAEWMAIAAGISNTDQASTLLGALQHADGVGEKLLRAFPAHPANALLNRIRACDELHRGFTESLLQFRGGPNFRSRSTSGPSAEWEPPPRGQGFHIGDVREAVYFFS